MNRKKIILMLAGLIGIILFATIRFSADLGLCPDTEIYSDGSKSCNATRGWGNYIWPLLNFSIATLIVGALNLIKPRANRALLILTAIAAMATTIAVLSAPDISRNILSPFDKKFVGQLCAGVYLFVGVIIWLRAYWKNK